MPALPTAKRSVVRRSTKTAKAKRKRKKAAITENFRILAEIIFEIGDRVEIPQRINPSLLVLDLP
jgi:hypothetical protein